MHSARTLAILIVGLLGPTSASMASMSPKHADPRLGNRDVAVDDSGNMLTKSGGDTYEWDYEDRLTRVTRAAGTLVDNTYDVDGVLVKTVVTPVSGPPSVTDFVVDTTGGLSHVVAEVRGGAVDALYVRAGDMLLSEIRGADVRYPEAEGIGSVRSLLDGGGATTDTWRYTAFGEEVARTGSDANPYQYAGERNVGEVGLYQNRARWLSTGAGAFVSHDPLDWAMRPLPPYSYADGQPIDRTDPMGTMSIGEVGIVGAIIGVSAVVPNFAGLGRVAYAQAAENRVAAIPQWAHIVPSQPNGEYHWRIRWRLTYAPAQDGWVVQHVNYTQRILAEGGVRTVFRNYSELWPVPRFSLWAANPEAVQAVLWNDDFGFPGGLVASGSVVWRATARFVARRTQAYMTGRGYVFPRNNDRQCETARDLPCKSGAPNLLEQDVGPPLNREKTHTWP